jgi:hypothetical protein
MGFFMSDNRTHFDLLEEISALSDSVKRLKLENDRLVKQNAEINSRLFFACRRDIDGLLEGEL